MITIRFWKAKSGRCYRTIQYPESTELISGDQNDNIRVWDLTANSCSCELVPEVDTAVRSLTVMWGGSLVVAANNSGTCYVWRLLRGTQTMTNFEPLHKLQAHDGYILKCLLSPEFCEPHRYLATASSDHNVKIWNVDGFTLEKTLVGKDFRVYQGHHKATGFCALNDGAEPSSRKILRHHVIALACMHICKICSLMSGREKILYFYGYFPF